MSDKSQFALLGQRRFLPFFLVQFLGAFNDNVYKTVLVLIFTFYIIEGDSNVLINIASGLFILPFFFSSSLILSQKNAIMQRGVFDTRVKNLTYIGRTLNK